MDLHRTQDYVSVAINYANECIRDENKKVGKWIKLAAKRFLLDLERAKNPDCDFSFVESEANNVCDFAEKCPHVEGNWGTRNIKLHPSHIFFLVQLFGFRHDDMTRRFTTALFAVARKNAKSTLAAIVMLYCLYCEGENGPQVISAATTGQQARIIFNIAKRMVEMTPDMQNAFSTKAFANSIVCYENAGTFKPINSKASTQDGLNPSCVGVDEVHAHKDHSLINVLKSAAGARKNPLFLYTTTEGYESPGPWGEMRKFAKQLLEGSVEADHYLAIYYAIDDEDSEFDESAWIKANPLADVNPLLIKEIAKESLEAKQMPGKRAEFLIKRCNRPSSSDKSEIDLQKWNACGGEIDLEFLKNHPCYGALDLSSTRDMSSFGLLWKVDGIFYYKVFYWVPSNQVWQRTERGAITYEAWVEAGHIKQLPGEIISSEFIKNDLLELVKTYKIQAIAFDPWNANDIVNHMIDSGINMIQFIQGPKSYSPAFNELEKNYLSKNLVHDNNPVLAWNASNLIARVDANMNRAPDRKRSSDKIDGIVCMLMCFGLWISNDHISPYETEDLTII